MSIASEITRLQGAKAAIKSAIEAKGVTVPSSVKLDVYDDYVTQIDGGGGGIQEKDVNFRDYDGTIVASYTAAEFANLASLPNNPSHEGLTAQGWNWTLADAKTFVAAHGGLEIGQMYVTDDGKTRLYLDLPHPGTVRVYCGLNGDDTGEGSNVIDWGDGTTSTPGSRQDHTYETAGKKMITLECKTSRTLAFGIVNNGPLLSGTLAMKSCYKIELGARIEIYYQAFLNLYNLISVTMPLGITSGKIGDSGNKGNNGKSFQNTAIRHITVPSDITTIGVDAFNMDLGQGLLHSISLPKGLTTIMSGAFRRIDNVKKLYIPDAVNYFFSSSSTITSGGGAFSNIRKLEKIDIPPNLTILPKETFRYNYLLDGVTLPSGLTGIGEYAFDNCRSLSEITIPANVNDIRASAFANTALSDVYLLPAVPPTLANKNAFPNNPTVLHVPHGCLTAYQTASVWSSLSSQMVEMPE